MSVAPQQPLAEENVLGAMMISSKAADKAIDALQPEHFYRETHGRLFGVMRDMSLVGIPLDSITVSAYAEERGVDVGGRHRVVELANLVPTTTNITSYAKLVHDAWMKRLVDRTLTDVLSRMETMTAEEAVTALEESALNVVTATENKHDIFIDLKRALQETEARFDNPLSEGWGIPTPFSFLQPLQGGRLYVLGSYPGDGKTTLATQFAATGAQVGRKVGILSLEMSYSDLTNRWLQQRTGISQGKFRTGRVDPSRIDTAKEEMKLMSGWDVTLVDDEAMTPQAVRKYQRLGKFDLLIIDHLHRMRWKDRHDLEDNIRAITNVAREFEVPVLLLCQLARAGDSAKPFPVPSLRQLRETAMLEAEASSVWFVYRERDEHHLQTNESKFIVAKNRYGRVGHESLYFDEMSTAFTEDTWRQPVEEPDSEPQGLVKF